MNKEEYPDYIKRTDTSDSKNHQKSATAYQAFNEFLRTGGEGILILPKDMAYKLHEKSLQVIKDDLQSTGQLPENRDVEGLFLDFTNTDSIEESVAKARKFLANRPDFNRHMWHFDNFKEFLNKETSLPFLTVVIQPTGHIPNFPEDVNQLVHSFAKYGRATLILDSESDYFTEPENHKQLVNLTNDPFAFEPEGKEAINLIHTRLYKSTVNPIHQLGLASRLDNIFNIRAVDVDYYNLPD